MEYYIQDYELQLLIIIPEEKMFTARLRHLCPSAKIIIRNLRNRKRLDSFGPNPGLDKRIAAFKRDGFKVDDEDAEEYVEQSESDFYKVGEVYNEHLNETLMGKYEQRHQIVKEKYFKQNMPNLLTWSEKEQIRHLATTQPDEWTPEKLAESFPVTVPVVKKLLKHVWKPATEQRIARHDQSVMRNWKELKEGTLSISEDVRAHFLKFSERTIPPLNRNSVKKIDVTPEEKIGEFENIIRRCAANENSDQKTFKQDYNTTKENEGEKMEKAPRDYKRVTLEELAQKIQTRLQTGQNVNVPDQIIVNTINDNAVLESKSVNINKSIEIFDNDNKNNLVQYQPENDSKDVMDYPERIRIPKKAYKKNATYKVNDCYYDHDGRFLYRVLGMTR